VAVALLAFVTRTNLRSERRILVRGYVGIALLAALCFAWLVNMSKGYEALAPSTIEAVVGVMLAEIAWTIGWMVGLVRLFYLEEKPVPPIIFS
jgi:hypothetical protein